MFANSVETFQRAVTAIGGGAARDLHAQLLAAWMEPQRRYHDVQHLDEGLTLIYRWGAGLSATELATLVLGWWFHDAVYDPRAHDNEQLSAQLVELELARVGVATEHRARVARLVQATDHRTPVPPGDQLTDLLLDVDLSILGAPAERFAQYEAQVAEEYSWVDAAAYAAGRGKVLAHFRALAYAEPSQLYRTDAGRTLLAQARANLGAPIEHDTPDISRHLR